MIIPPLFKCPISLDLFTDPVTLCTGQTYDRPSIEKWLAAGNTICPVTMQKLEDLSIVPNQNLRHLIDQWLQEGTRIDDDYIEIIDHDHSVAALKQNLESDESTSEEKVETLQKIQVLLEELPLQNSCLIQLDFFQSVLQLIFQHRDGVYLRDDLRFLEQALSCALKLLPFSDLSSLNLLKNESNFMYFLSLFEKDHMHIKRHLCLLVEVISTSLETQELCSMLGKSCKLLQEIVRLVCEKSVPSEAGIKAMAALCSTESNLENMVRQGAIEGLIEYIMNAEERQQSLAPMAAWTIEKLLAVESAKEVIINHPNGLRALIKMVFRVSDHEGSESAVNSLMAVCYNSIHATEGAIFGGVLTQLLLLLQSQCSGRTKTKATMLLKLLRSTWDQDSIHVL